MEILNEDNGKKGSFYIESEGQRVAEMHFVWAGDKVFIVDHTEVDQSLEGKGIGRQLVSHAVDFARSHEYKIIPLCPFTKAVISKTPEFQDVVKE